MRRLMTREVPASEPGSLHSKQARDRVSKPMMRPPQIGDLHPLITRDIKPRPVPPGPRPLGGAPVRGAIRTDLNDVLRLASAGAKR